MSAIVTLSAGEMCLGAFVGSYRQAVNLAAGRKQTHGSPQEASLIHIVGAQGEFAVSKYLNLFWSGSLNFRAPDVGGEFDVRTAMGRGRLIIYADDPDDRPFILVWSIGEGQFEIAGCAMAGDCKQAKFERVYRPGGRAFFVPTDVLLPIEALHELKPLVKEPA